MDQVRSLWLRKWLAGTAELVIVPPGYRVIVTLERVMLEYTQRWEVAIFAVVVARDLGTSAVTSAGTIGAVRAKIGHRRTTEQLAATAGGRMQVASIISSWEMKSYVRGTYLL